jgi:6-phosphogluconolactonase/glucosamine-6-phosphate isomerase/deaminase
MVIHTVQSDQVIKEATEALNSLFLKQKGKNFLFMVSGGSALSLLEHIDTSYFGVHSTVCVLDERYSTDSRINNMAQLKKTNFYKSIKEKGSNFIDTEIHHGEIIEDVAKRFEESLRAWIDKTHGNIIASVGVGPDAHTSGIMPFPENAKYFDDTFNNEKCWVVSYDAKEKNQYNLRITTTLPFLRKIDSAVIYITGENKKPALQKLVTESGSLAESPCRIWREVPGATVYTDIKI